MRTLILAGAMSFMLALPVPHNGALSAAHARAADTASAALIKPNRYGLPDFGDLVDEVGPAVVNISVVRRQETSAMDFPFADDPFYDFLRRFGVPTPGMPGHPGRGPRISRGIGSGFIVSSDGYVLTNAHVVGEAGADTEVTVRLIDKREFKAELIGSDTRTDIALLKIDAEGLPTVRLGDAEQARVGEWVVAMGSPFGFDNTVTAGIISAKARRLPDENYVPFIQTDVAINPGNSGGPLFNLAGEVIGINSQIYSRSGGFMGISFAIPIDVALHIKDQLIEFGRVQRGKLGVTIQGVDKDLAQNFGLAEPMGALVSSVEPGSAAEKAGVQPGDVVIGVDGTRVGESSDLPRMIGEKRPGTKIRLDVWRDGKRQTLDVTLDEMQAQTATAPGARPGEDLGGKLGLQGRNLSADEASRLGVRGGVAVEQVSGAAANAGLQAGDVILALNNQPVANLAQLRQLLERSGNRFALLIQRGNNRIYVPVRIG
ncbi:MAG: DegQ family serine endoprotease [Rhodocyclaceae bacterium]|jgi:serine protease Do|nr:DegQ family serine endoprotease [Rhodocyclaceae bacterium]MCL4757949.1 DegQ family serine endoprotease [Rhodocyclaceae bacterium]